MELNSYQLKAMNQLTSYVRCLNETNDIYKAWNKYWNEQDVCVGFGGVPTYQNTIKGTPHICMKVPTGGGKTFMACAALKKIFENMPKDRPKMVIWLVPSDSIYEQTLKNLSNPEHPYRRRLDNDFSGRVGVYTKEQLLNGHNFSPDTVKEMLTVCIMTYNSLRVNSTKKDIRKVYQENGNLIKFADYFKDGESLLADTPDTALIQILRLLTPVAIVDESHNVTSDLSLEMLDRLNPSFILDLTATPRKNSNIISYVDARELKAAHMIKLPVVVYNRNNKISVIQDAIQLRGNIEKQALEQEKKSGKYIRPIVLFQAQPNFKSKNSETFDKIKKTLIDIGIPENEIAIKTSEVDELKNVNLMSKDCEIRYIITVNALKEGWDCPFAYILASLANKTSAVDVEQIVGRVLRLPYAASHNAPLLNISYVLASSNDFRATLDSVVKGLNNAGFSKDDYRIGTIEEHTPPEFKAPEFVQEELTPPSEEIFQPDDLSEITPEEISEIKESLETTAPTVESMISDASQLITSYDEEEKIFSNTGFIGGELGEMLNQYPIQKDFKDKVCSIQLPQFFIKSAPDLFGEGYEILEPERLSEGFKLSEQEATISFDLASGDMYKVDIQDNGDAVPKYKRTSKDESEFLKEYLSSLAPEAKVSKCAELLCREINKNNRYAATDIKDYIQRVISNMTSDDIAQMETSIPLYAFKISKKIESLEKVFREKVFYKWIDSGKVTCKPEYTFPSIITPSTSFDSVPKSLYTAEKKDLNNFESKILDYIVSLDNIEWWHRIIEKRGFRINGFTNHYPDFIVCTKSGIIVLVEAKGDDRDNSDSKRKIKLGKCWQSQVGSKFRYFMVFENNKIEDSYNVEDFIEILSSL